MPNPPCAFVEAWSTCTHNSRVGVRISTRVRRGPSINRSMIGSVNAAVLPVPVWARPMMSLPRRVSGMDSRWIGVGVV